MKVPFPNQESGQAAEYHWKYLLQYFVNQNLGWELLWLWLKNKQEQIKILKIYIQIYRFTLKCINFISNLPWPECSIMHLLWKFYIREMVSFIIFVVHKIMTLCKILVYSFFSGFFNSSICHYTSSSIVLPNKSNHFSADLGDLRYFYWLHSSTASNICSKDLPEHIWW